MAAQVAAVTGLVGASIGITRAAEPPPIGSIATSATAAEGEKTTASTAPGLPDRIAESLRVRAKGSGGCMPSWGPPAPPAMRAEHRARWSQRPVAEAA